MNNIGQNKFLTVNLVWCWWWEAAAYVNSCWWEIVNTSVSKWMWTEVLNWKMQELNSDKYITIYAETLTKFSLFPKDEKKELTLDEISKGVWILNLWSGVLCHTCHTVKRTYKRGSFIQNVKKNPEHSVSYQWYRAIFHVCINIQISIHWTGQGPEST